MAGGVTSLSKYRVKIGILFFSFVFFYFSCFSCGGWIRIHMYKLSHKHRKKYCSTCYTTIDRRIKSTALTVMFVVFRLFSLSLRFVLFPKFHHLIVVYINSHF